MRWVGHIWYLGEQEMHTKFWFENLMGRDYLESICVDASLTLQFILSWWVSVWTQWGWVQWQAFVNMLMDIQVSGNLKSWPDELLSSAQGQTLHCIYGYIHLHIKPRTLFMHWKVKSVSKEPTDWSQKQDTHSCHGMVKLPESERCFLIPETYE